jgi:hypothetical protein
MYSKPAPLPRPVVAETDYPKTSLGLKLRLRETEQRIRSASAQRTNAQTRLSQLRHKQEELQQKILLLLEERSKFKSRYLSLYDRVSSDIREARKKVFAMSKFLDERKTEQAAKEAVLLGLRARFVRNSILLWTTRLRQFQNALQVALDKRKRLEQDIRILSAQKQGIILKAERLVHNDKRLHLASRRRGKIIAGQDLSLLSENLAVFSKKTGTRANVAPHTNKKIHTGNRRPLRDLYSEYAIAISEKKREGVSRADRIRDAYIRKERLALELSELKIQRDDLARRIVAERERKKLKSFAFHISLKNLQKPARKQLVIFSILVLVLTAPVTAFGYIQRASAVKGKVLGESKTALQHLLAAGKSTQTVQFSDAASQFQSAAQDFQEALAATQSLGGEVVAMSQAIPQTRVLASGAAFLRVADNVSQAGQRLSSALEKLNGSNFHITDSMNQKKVTQANQNIQSANPRLTDALIAAKPDFVSANAALQSAVKELRNVHAGEFPAEYVGKISAVQDLLPRVATALRAGVDSLDALLEILGATGKRRYLLAFQNNTEMRGTGGFIGSFGLADIDHGSVTNIKIDATYDPDGQLLEALYPPTPLRQIAPKWFMRDANWYPDFPTAAHDIKRLYEKTGGPSVDGVIALTPTVIENLLKVTGPVEVPEDHETVDADNFLKLTEYKVEIDYDKVENKPKKFLSNLMPHVLSKLFSLPKEKWLDVATTLQNAVIEKHILAYFSDEKTQDVIEKAGASGEMKSAPFDSLSIINSNIRGLKTDNLINEKINQTVNIDTKGKITETVRITRTHTGDYTWPSGRNRDYVRVYVPMGATLLHATGFEDLAEFSKPYECKECTTDPAVASVEAGYHHDDVNHVDVGVELGKTVFAGWQVLEPGESKIYEFTYELRERLGLSIINQAQTYSVYVQKQSGSLGSDYALEIHVPSGYDYAKIYPVSDQQVVSVKNGAHLQFATRLTRDRFLATVITQ